MPTFLEGVKGVISQTKKHPRIAVGVGVGAVGCLALAWSALREGNGGAQKTPTPQVPPGVRDGQSALPQTTLEPPRRIDNRSTVIYNGKPYKCATIKNPERPNAMRAAMSVNRGELPDADVLWIPKIGEPLLDDLGRLGRERPGEERIFVHEGDQVCVVDHGLSSLGRNGSILYHRGESYQEQAWERMVPQMQANTPYVTHAARGI